MPGQSLTHYWGDVLTMAGFYVSKPEEIPDNKFDGIPLLEFLAKKGRVQFYDGGEIIQEPLMYAKEGGGGSYANYDILDTDPGENWTMAEYRRKGYYQSATISGQELRSRSDRQIRDLAKQRVGHAVMRNKDDINSDLYLDGTSNNQKAIGGLAAYIKENPAVDPTIAVGGLLGATNTWWRNYFKGAIGSFASNGINEFDVAWIQISRGRPSGIPDLIIGTPNAYQYFEASQHSKQQFYMNATQDKDLDPGFARLWYKGIPVVFDINCPADSGSKEKFLWINSRYLFLRVHPGANFKQDPWIRPSNQEAITSQNIWEGNLTMNNRRHQGILFGIQA
jgi:hypothetical protein